MVLAAGNGVRMAPLPPMPKVCLPVANRTLLRRHLELMHVMGIDDVVVVVGFMAATVVQAVAGETLPAGMTVRFAEQPEPRGIADALSRVRGSVSNRLAVVLADTYIEVDDALAGIRRLRDDGNGGAAAVLSVRDGASPEAIRKECSVRFDDNGHLVEIREKPAILSTTRSPAASTSLPTVSFPRLSRHRRRGCGTRWRSAMRYSASLIPGISCVARIPCAGTPTSTAPKTC